MAETFEGYLKAKEICGIHPLTGQDGNRGLLYVTAVIDGKNDAFYVEADEIAVALQKTGVVFKRMKKRTRTFLRVRERNS